MDNLLCDESLLSVSLTPATLPNSNSNAQDNDSSARSLDVDEAMLKEAIIVDFRKESRFSIHGDKFLEFLFTRNLSYERLQMIYWMIKSRERLGLSYETIFSAASIFDRFIYITNCDEWSKWKIELVAVVSLSIASKFTEVGTSPLEDIQLEGLTHTFHRKTIFEMEFIVMRVLEWCVNSVTSYSFSQNLMLLLDDVTKKQLTEKLLDCLCDMKMLQYPPTVVAVSVGWYVILTTLNPSTILNDNVERLVKLFGQEHEDYMLNCVDVLKSQTMEHWSSMRNIYQPNGFMRMLLIEELIYRSVVYTADQLSTEFQIWRLEGEKKKRERDEYEEQMLPAKKRTSFMSY